MLQATYIVYENWMLHLTFSTIFFQLYTAYIANFDKSSETLAAWTKKSPKFAAIIEEIQVQ